MFGNCLESPSGGDLGLGNCLEAAQYTKDIKLTMTTCRVDFDGLKGMIFGTGEVVLIRKQPPQLAAHMADVHWDKFCDSIDEALKPLDELRRRYRRQFSCALVAMVFFFLAFPITLTVVSVVVGDETDHPIWVTILFVLIFVGIMISFGILLSITAKTMIQAKKHIDEAREVCDDVSTHYPDLTFRIKFDHFLYMPKGGVDKNHSFNTKFHRYRIENTHYMEVTIADATKYVSDPFEYTETTADRLVELDSIKPLLSDDEYNDKRRKILDGL